jgi:glycosyltransferase involved in cell wall biosynthesis
MTIGYLIPAVSTWVMEEILEVKENKINVEVFCLCDPAIPSREIVKRILSRDAQKVANKINYLQDSPFRYLQAHLFYLRTSPANYISIWALLLRRLGRQLFFLSKHKQNLFLGAFLKVPYLTKIIQSKEIVHIHSHFATRPTFIAMMVSKLTGIPFSLTTHDEIFLSSLDFSEEFNQCSFIITTSKYSRKYLIAKYGKSLESKLTVIYLGIDIEKFFFCEEKKQKQGFIVSSVGFLVPKKGFSYLIEAAKLLKEKGYQFQVVIAGEGPERNNLERLVSQLSLKSTVYLPGMISTKDLPHFFGRSDIFIFPSVIAKDGSRDVIPVAIMEAMAMGLPVVATNVGGIPELVEHKKTGILVLEKNAHELAVAIELLIKSEKLRKRLGRAGQEKVRDEFNLQINVKRKIELFKTFNMQRKGQTLKKRYR